MSDFTHAALYAQKHKPLVYTAMSKYLFYFRMHVSVYVLEQGGVPLNPFMNFDYFLLDTVNRDTVREANNNLVHRCDEIWVFGEVSDGVLAEIIIAKERDIPIKYYEVQHSKEIIEITTDEVELEADVLSMRHML